MFFDNIDFENLISSIPTIENLRIGASDEICFPNYKIPLSFIIAKEIKSNGMFTINRVQNLGKSFRALHLKSLNKCLEQGLYLATKYNDDELILKYIQEHKNLTFKQAENALLLGYGMNFEAPKSIVYTRRWLHGLCSVNDHNEYFKILGNLTVPNYLKIIVSELIEKNPDDLESIRKGLTYVFDELCYNYGMDKETDFPKLYRS